MKIAWFSCGCSSLVASKLANPDKVIYIHVPNQHPDTLRFFRDAEKMLGYIEILQSTEFDDVDDVIETTRYINGPYGARCTLELKKRVRQKWERENWGCHTYVWGFDCKEKRRAERIIESMPEFNHEFPLIENGLTKEDAHALCARWGIKRPIMYDLGYPNNNCVGCVKGGKGYWNKIRKDFPEVFNRRAKQERELGKSCIRGTYLDELSVDDGKNKIVIPDCSLACELAYDITK